MSEPSYTLLRRPDDAGCPETLWLHHGGVDGVVVECAREVLAARELHAAAVRAFL